MTSVASLACISFSANSNVADHVLLGIGHGFVRNLVGAATCGLGLALELPHGLIGRLDEAVEGMFRLGHALLDERPNLLGHSELLERFLGHPSLL